MDPGKWRCTLYSRYYRFCTKAVGDIVYVEVDTVGETVEKDAVLALWETSKTYWIGSCRLAEKF